MKRKGYILEQIAEIDNLREADRLAQYGKDNRAIRRHNMKAEENLFKLQNMILNLDFPEPKYKTLTFKSDGGKIRNIVVQTYFPWRILHHAIMLVIEPDFEKGYIHDTSACIKGRGTHYGVTRVKSFLRRYKKNKWFAQTDYKKFYESIPHDIIINALRRKYKDEKLIELFKIAILTFICSPEIIQDLENEKKKRNANRLLYESADWELHSNTARPSCERKAESKVLSSTL